MAMATATAWVRALSCTSTAVAADVYSPPAPPPPKKHPPMPPKGSAALLPAKESRRSSSLEHDRPARRKKKKNKDTSELARKSAKQFAALPMAMASPKRPSQGSFLEMTELPEGHPSRRVVELIFASGWGFPHDDAPVPEAEMEALFRVQNTARTVARFEDARRAAMLARGADARCAADGNEMMRFQCRAADGNGQVICAAVATTGPSSAVRTFAGSGAAHAGAGGGALEGRRGVLVCRAIAGRVRRRASDDPAREAGAGEGSYDSVEAGGGELVVLDRRAVLPCFLVVYKVKPALYSSSFRRPR